MRRLLFLLALTLSLLLGSCDVAYHLAAFAPEHLIEQGVSPDVGCHQGYATDGTTHFIFDTKRILARANDATWHITRVNDSPFDGMADYNHLGDGDYFENKLYVPAEQYKSCSDDRNPAIFIFDSTKLVRTAVFPLPENEEVSGVAVRPEASELWVSSYCDASRIWVYDLQTIRLVNTVHLNPTVPKIQGITYREGSFYLAQNSGSIRKMYLDGTSIEIYKTGSSGAHEGLDYSQGELRWLIDQGLGQQKIHFLVPESASTAH